jgi:DNA-binding response OmpR family regulator
MRVLVVEDERKLATLLRRVLMEEQYTVDVVHDGATALDYAAQGCYDLIVLDIMLPGRSGIEVCRWLRAHDIHTPVLLLTARDQVEDKVEGLDAGADDYLTKPFAFEELLARLRALGRRRPQADGPTVEPLSVGDLALDLVRHEARRGGRLIPLTPREFALLEYLMRNAGRVLTRTQILARVWPEGGAEAVSNVVDIYIHYLREKVDRDFPTPLIYTVRGVGYVLRAEGATP